MSLKSEEHAADVQHYLASASETSSSPTRASQRPVKHQQISHLVSIHVISDLVSM